MISQRHVNNICHLWFAMPSRAFGNVLSQYLLLTPCSEGSYRTSINVVSFEEQLSATCGNAQVKAEGIIKAFWIKDLSFFYWSKPPTLSHPYQHSTATNRELPDFSITLPPWPRYNCNQHWPTNVLPPVVSGESPRFSTLAIGSGSIWAG